MNKPERATRSVLLRPFLAKAAVRLARSKVGAGRSLLARDKLAVVESLLPRRTLHEGPPNCKHTYSKADLLTPGC
jgi:hypothetical protein